MTETDHVRHLARVRTLLEGALELEAGERVGWLQRMCGEEPELERELRDLLGRAETGGALAEYLGESRGRRQGI